MTQVQINNEIPAAMDFFALFETTGWNQAYQATPHELQQALDDSWYTVSAYHNGELVGFGRVLSDGVLYAMIYDLIVHPDFQNDGVGTALNHLALEKMQEAGMKLAEVGTGGDEGHAPARTSYEKAGYIGLPLVRYYKKLR